MTENIKECITIKKYTINGKTFIRLDDICSELRYLRNHAHDFDNIFSEKECEVRRKSFDEVVRVIFRNELEAAQTDEERERIMEMPGEFIVCRRVSGPPYVEAFFSWENGKPIISLADNATRFTYESRAQSIAERLAKTTGNKWFVVDMSDAATERTRRLLKAIFDKNHMEEESE